MTVVQFPSPSRSRPHVVTLQPAGAITRSRFQEAHDLADEAERLPPMSEAVAMFIAAAKAKLTEVSGDIETELQAMSDRQLSDMSAAMIAICDLDPVTLEDDFVGDLVAFEVSRRETGGSFGPDGAA